MIFSSAFDVAAAAVAIRMARGKSYRDGVEKAAALEAVRGYASGFNLDAIADAMAKVVRQYEVACD